MSATTIARRTAIVVTALGVLSVSLAFASGASATTAWWQLNTVSAPTILQPGGEGVITVSAADLGNAEISGAASAVRLVDRLRGGVTATSASLRAGVFGIRGSVSCSLPTPALVECMFEGQLPPYEALVVEIQIQAASGAQAHETGEVAVEGGEASGLPVQGTSVSQPLSVSGTANSFGIESYSMLAANEDGSPDTQAGSHPFDLTTTLTLKRSATEPWQPAVPKDLSFQLPPGLIGNPTPFPQCSDAQFAAGSGGVNGWVNRCPNDTALGVATVVVRIASGELNRPFTIPVPLFNLRPSPGEPARFGFVVFGVPAVLDTSVRTGDGYGVTVTVHNITELASFYGSQVTLWGAPGAAGHDSSRGWSCVDGGFWAPFAQAAPCEPNAERNPPPLLTLPTSCTGQLATTVQADSYAHEGVWTEPFEARLPGLSGCNRLPFEASINVAPASEAGSSPTGLTVGIHVPQTASLNGKGLAQSTVKDTTVTLPAGVALNPSAADGLLSCSEAQIGLSVDAPPACPESSKVGLVRIRTPLLPNELTGAAYLAAQEQNPFGSLFALYIVAQDPVSGSLIKVAGEIRADPVTGQLVSTFKETPQLPFEDFKLEFFGGSRAPLVTPSACGSYTTVASFAPWSGNASADSSSTFNVSSGPNGSPCHDPLPFDPSLTTGTSSIQAGGFSPFAMTMSREDGEQTLQGVQLKMPLGVSGTLSSVKLCGEQQADEGTCGPESEIGETIVSVGVGGNPYTVKGGKVYITGPYKGAPFGLSIVNPAKAGPFDLGKVVVRAKLEVNEETAAIAVTTDTEGPYKIPTILDGIPLEIRHVFVNIDRPGFTFNATNCNPLKITGVLSSTEGASSTLSVPYQVTNCAVLAFKPKLEAATGGKWTRTGGTSLNVKLSYPAGPYDANISKVKVELPTGLPSRLPTLQKACLASVFEANPAACPPASIIGHARASTPVLPVPLEGPAYFVSHGGEAWPSLVIVLQGYGVTVHLVGTTLISKAGVTSSTFKTVPDVPVGTFELNLPAGPFSALTGLGNLCKSKTLAMPTEFVGQNGAEIHTTTKIAVTGCAKTKKATHKKKHRPRAKHPGKGRKK